MQIHTDYAVEEKFNRYPSHVRPIMQHLRELILETASEQEDIDELYETLKWGEPSFVVKKGSTLRIDWKEKSPDQYAIYFKCTSKLVPTFRTLFDEKFTFEKNRAILFELNQAIPKPALKACVAMALNYHSIKHKHLLGYSRNDM